MACSLVGAKPLSDSMLNEFQWNSRVFIRENAFEIVCEMAAILPRPQCIKSKYQIENQDGLNFFT